MLVKAKWHIKDKTGWHATGEVFQTDDDLGNAVEVISGPEKKEPKASVPEVKSPEPEAAQEAEKPKTTSRRKKVSE